MNKKNIMPLAILSGICIVVAAIMGAINMVTAPMIEKYEQQKVYDSLREVLDGEFETVELTESTPSSVTGVYKVTDDEGNLKGNVVTVEKQGYASKICLTIGIDKDGKTTKVVVTAEQETHGKNISGLIEALSAGVSAEAVDGVENVTGATKTSEYIKAALKDAFAAVGLKDAEPEAPKEPEEPADEEEEETLPKTDEEQEEIAKGMISEEVTLSKVDFTDAPSFLKRIYEAGEEGYFLYIVVPGDYVPVATEAMVLVNGFGKIEKTELLSWIVGHGVESGDFADRFNGKDKESVGSVELVTGATGTSDDFKQAVLDSLKYLVEKYDLKEELPTSDEEIKVIASEMAGKELVLSNFEVKDAPETLKRVYRAKEVGYFLYIVVEGDYVPVETEAIVYLDESCAVRKTELLSWTGTTEKFRSALEAAVVAIADGDKAKETILYKKMESLVPNAVGFEKVPLPENAAKSLKALYKVEGFDGYVAYIITSTKYVEVETEALVYINSKGAVGNIEIMSWNVGHGIEPGDFADSLIGKNKKGLSEVELVTSATVTAGNLRDAIVEAIAVVPTSYTPTVIGIAVLVVMISAVATIMIVKRRKNG